MRYSRTSGENQGDPQVRGSLGIHTHTYAYILGELLGKIQYIYRMKGEKSGYTQGILRARFQGVILRENSGIINGYEQNQPAIQNESDMDRCSPVDAVL